MDSHMHTSIGVSWKTTENDGATLRPCLLYLLSISQEMMVIIRRLPLTQDGYLYRLWENMRQVT